MKRLLLSGLCVLALNVAFAQVNTIIINETEQPVKTLINRQLGPGVEYTRLRLPNYPLNVNMLKIDLTNPYNNMETTQASNTLFKTESLVTAAKRQSSEGHKAVAGANANFWCVSGQPPYSDLLLGMTFNGNMRNGKIITETNCRADQWNGGPKHTGIFGVTEDKTAYSGNNFTWEGYISSNKFGPVEFTQANKLTREDEICIYNSYFGTDKKFIPADQALDPTDGKVHFYRHENETTEVYLNIKPETKWNSGNNIEFVVADVKQNAGSGTLGSYDLAICGRGNKLAYLNQLQPGDVVNVAYYWKDPNGNKLNFDNLVGGNAQVMVNGELTKYNDSENYNSQVYSRTGYGTSADGKTAYIIVIDKSTSVWGNSAGCPTSVMCQIAKAYGCVNLTNFDAGGSAEMLVQGAIINTTTESSPRAVANGMLIYSNAPTDNTVTSLAFYDYELQMPRYSSFSPRIIAYNQYGDIVTDDLKGFTLSCPEVNGKCEGDEILVSGVSGEFDLTVTYEGVSTTKKVNVIDSKIIVRIPNLLIDNAREYQMEISATVGQNKFIYDPTKIEWTSGDTSIAEIDANGVVRGVSEGTTTITGLIGDFETTTNVTVEIANAPNVSVTNWANYTASGTSGCTLNSFENGVLTFTYGSPRNPSLLLRNSVDDFYSIPESIAIEFTSTATLSQVSFSALTPASSEATIIYCNPEDGGVFAANTNHTVTIPVADICDASDLINYPVSIDFIRFTPEKTTANKGTHTITVTDVRGEYKSFDSVADIAINPAGTIAVTPAVPAPGEQIVVTASSAIKSVSVFGIDGKLASYASASLGAQAAAVKAPAHKGIYIIAVTTAAGNSTRKIIVK